MTAKIIDGIAIARQVRIGIAARAAVLKSHTVLPALTVILVGNNPASALYVRNKVRACAEVGIRSEVVRLPSSESEESLLARIRALNEAADVRQRPAGLCFKPLIGGTVAHADAEAKAATADFVNEGRRLSVIEGVAAIDVGDRRTQGDAPCLQRERLAQSQTVAKTRAVDAAEATFLNLPRQFERLQAPAWYRDKANRGHLRH